jgi:hypothetical protein
MVSGQKFDIYDSEGKYAPKREIPTIFANLSKAQESLESQWHVASYSTSDLRDLTSEKLPAAPQPSAWQMKSRSILARWSSAYDVYLNFQGGSMTEKRKKGTAALRILKELGSITRMVTQTTIDDQMSWDAFGLVFQNIVSLAEDIVELDQKSVPGKPSFCIDMAVIGPLFQVSLLSNVHPSFNDVTRCNR